MRELSLVELELIVGGYGDENSGGGYDGSGEAYGSSSFSYVDGVMSGSIADGDQDGIVQALGGQDIAADDIGIEIKKGSFSLKVTLPTPKSHKKK